MQEPVIFAGITYANFIHNFWFIQAIGAVALAFAFLGWNAKTRRGILLLQSANLLFFIIHYFLLSAFTGAVMCFVLLARNLMLCEKNKKKRASHWVWFYVFTFAALGVLAFSWNGWISILPVTATILSMYAMWQDRPADVRYYMFIVCLIWIPYTIAVESYSGLLNELIGMAGIISGMYRHDRKSAVEVN